MDQKEWELRIAGRYVPNHPSPSDRIEQDDLEASFACESPEAQWIADQAEIERLFEQWQASHRAYEHVRRNPPVNLDPGTPVPSAMYFQWTANLSRHEAVLLRDYKAWLRARHGDDVITDIP